MKKFIISLLSVILSFVFFTQLSVNSAVNLEKLKLTSGNGYVKYMNSSVEVQIPIQYTKQQSEFRGVWVSPLVGDISSYSTDEQQKNQLLSVLDMMESYGMNAIVFHVRIMNDALYQSDLNPQSSYTRNANYENWDYLEWFIEEVHSRGMEFHAWLNPYRIANTVTTLNQVLAKYASYPNNPASKAENVIIGTKGAILNPGEPAVREFVIDTVVEIMERYDVDAIHFDDYFYASMADNADATTYNKYKGNSQTKTIADWRREQVDIFIRDLSTTIRKFNKDNNRFVQLGIAPTGIWKNGNGIVEYDDDGTAITTGSNTRGQEHYESYLYANTKKWVDNEWIDYITPQSYWAFEHNVAGYADVVDWWAKVVKNKKVNLYTGMGLYMKYNTTSNTFSWQTNPNEAANQIRYNTKHPEIKGATIFNYKYLAQAKSLSGIQTIINDYWANPVIGPEIGTMTPITPGQVTNVRVVREGTNVMMRWDSATNAKRYAVYRSEGEVNVDDPSQLIKILGPNSDGNNIIVDVVDENKVYNYKIVAVSGTNRKGTPVATTSESNVDNIGLPIGEIGDVRISGTVFPNNTIQLIFTEAKINVGTSVYYSLEISTDKKNWQSIPSSELRRVGTNYSYNTKMNEIGQVIYVKVTAENLFGSITSNITEVRVKIGSLQDYLELQKYILDYQVKRLFE